jgi:hypothetical protein
MTAQLGAPRVSCEHVQVTSNLTRDLGNALAEEPDQDSLEALHEQEW